MYGAQLLCPHMCGGLLAGATRQTLPSLTSTAKKFFNIPKAWNNVLGKNYLTSRTYSFFNWGDAKPCTAEVQNIISYYQTNGHRFAKLNPLQICEREQPKPPLNECDLDKVYTLPRTTKIGGDKSALPLREIVRRLESTYCSSIGVEFMHIDDERKCDWIKGRFEPPRAFQMTPEEKKSLLYRLLDTTRVSEVLRTNWPKEQGFSLEGCDVLIPALHEIIDWSSWRGVDSYIIGMPHRGRLNVLANVFKEPLEKIFYKFHSDIKDEGDVLYHLGTYTAIQNEVSKRHTHLSLVASPSHAESVDPVVLGKTKAEQMFRSDPEGNMSMSILVHGDAAFSGQGVVYETFHLSILPDYATHGTIHFVVNNQIHPQTAHSSLNCTNVGKLVSAPIFRVNADDPEAVIHVCRVAAEWRATFKSDVLIELVGYRRFGHSEVDDPTVICPTMSKEIANHEKVVDIYSVKLMDSGIIIEKDYEAKRDEYNRLSLDAVQKKGLMTTSKSDWLDHPQEDVPLNTGHIPSTGIAESRINHIGAVYCTIPKDITPFSGIEGAFQKRLNMLQNGECDWAMGEALAFGSLLEEEVHVRLSGQHVTTGIYSRRHHVIQDQEVENKQYSPLCNISPNQAQYTVCNSSLSEFAVLGFELGFSIGNPHSLVCWEAQFGDFHNTAQCIIDQYISSGEEKWARSKGLVLLLSHGYEGMGPEHSSARLERFLQLCSDDADCQPDIDNSSFECDQLYACNMQVINCTTPANYFHALRRQVKMPFKKPLIVMTLKSPWEYPSSNISDMTEKTNFIRLIPDTTAPEGEGVRRIVFCSGKVYYELVKQREMADLTDTVAISRLEQISPFPYDLVDRELSRFPAADIVWSQEEPKNMGAWSYVQPRFQTATGNNRSIRYTGRPPRAAVATGSKAVHKEEQEKLVNMAFTV